MNISELNFYIELTISWYITLPLFVIQLVKVVTIFGDVLEVRGQLQKLLILFSIQVTLTERLDAQAALRIHQKIASNVIEHNGVARTVLFELAPDNKQRLHLNNASFRAMNLKKKKMKIQRLKNLSTNLLS